MSLREPSLATYIQLEPDSKTVNLLDLCRRLVGEWQYQDLKCLGQLTQPPFKGSISDYENKAVLGLSQEMVSILKEMPITKFVVEADPLKENSVTAKQFKCLQAGNGLTSKKLLKIYWRLRMRYSCATFNQTVGQMVEELKKRGYAGFLLPNGKAVTFDSLNFVLMWAAPNDLNIIEFQDPAYMRMFKLAAGMAEAISLPPELLEAIMKFDGKDIYYQHVALAFNLPEGDQSRLMIIDSTCAQFGMSGSNGELIYWGYYDDYSKRFPSKRLTIQGFERYNYTDPGFYPNGPGLMKEGLANMDSAFCGYCGEVERSKDPEIKLKKCTKCKVASYCDVICQKLAWPSHKLECKAI